ncbi:hypothetical protein RKE25_22815 (plasmid) [Dyella sp. BiH032]|uniref:hypothetical protein n=1 Tax=Dyella sp. BiH032 TaxID=3075430 RepID=UPI0028932B22|nr:hypothetical protein [Dyella sp. BiH032]WNL48368.1 hypothetical protein RKE25_22815 [Dyella sp. BiH032]
MSTPLPDDLNERLRSLYDEMLWLAGRPGITPSMARAWYTHIVSNRLARQIRFFTGEVSRSALADPRQRLTLEHFKRLQTRLTALVEGDLAGPRDAEAFIRVLRDLEQVRITTLSENYAAMKANGDYDVAGIDLVQWDEIPEDVRRVLWERVLNGKVMNYEAYAVPGARSRSGRQNTGA